MLKLAPQIASMSGEATNSAEMRQFIRDIGAIAAPVDMSRIQQFGFRVDDIPFFVTHRPRAATGESAVCIQATLGFLPYSVESGGRREAIMSIIDSTRELMNVRFGVDRQNRIFAAGAYASDTLTAPDFVFYPLMLFLQEARPFFSLIGACFAQAYDGNKP